MPFANARKERSAIILASAVAAGIALAQPALAARDGVNGCSVAEVEADGGTVWRHTIELQVPEGGYCRVYIGEDKDRKTWKYCWLKRAPENPVTATCDDPIDDNVFDGWKAKAVCGKYNSIAYCRREKPLVPSVDR